ncbi:DedA family protein [Paenibacillus sp. 1011MAR3C5]|uniref:DedA family protein n=1 Tax=Paenibacillus sp. 1011MAR3C5 TaxID=1675787 RepID=UPI000E6B5EDB|nr:DedA family protein [Paenibacillus sp. 1011MAR3C5]RJE86911.1 DedA family protein [Paenibacillus sp. 1011MAR3C5]
MKLLEIVEQLFADYGYLVLLMGLPLDAIALPIPPGNTTLTYTGYLAYKGVLHWLPAVASAYVGAIIGITITYWIGYKFGQPLFDRYGDRLLLKPVHMEKTKKAYEKHGNKLLLFSFFMPGIRQFIGYATGIIRVPFRTFALYAYTGAALWVIVFTGIGFLFGEQWKHVLVWVEQSLLYVTIGVFGALTVFLIVKWRKHIKQKGAANQAIDR